MLLNRKEKVIQEQLPKAVVLSDDLTGAVAAAGEAARAGARTEIVHWDCIPSLSNAHALIVDTNSRLLNQAEAAERVRACTVAALYSFGPGTLMYKRVDSLLRGNTHAEMTAWHDVVQRPVVLAAAAPSYGITTRSGRQEVNGMQLDLTDAVGEESSAHPYQLLDSEVLSLQALRSESFPVRLAANMSAGRSVVVDSESLNDLNLVATGIRKVQRDGTDLALAGSYGLLGAWFETELERERPGVLVVATSYREATRQQIEVIAQGLHTIVLDATRGADGVVDEAVKGLRAGMNVALTTMRDRSGLASPNAAVAVNTAQTAARILADVTPTGLVLLGGEVSSALIRLLKPQRLSVLGEPWPATPITRIEGGNHDGMLAIIQSGSQGDAMRTLHAIELLASDDRRRTNTSTGGQ